MYYNGESLYMEPVLFNGIGIGSNMDEVIEKFNIKSGYANINMEVPIPEHDGTTDIIDVVYKDKNSFEEYFLDAMIEFGYKKNITGWKMVKFTDIDDADILFNIDINGLYDEDIDKDDVISIYVEYLEK